MANRSYGSTFCTISATLASSWSRSSVCVVAADTSSRKSSSSLRSRNRTVALRVACMDFSVLTRTCDQAAVASTIFTLALAPIRVAPAAVIVFTSSSVRIPPDAFTPISGPTAARISAISCAVAPDVAEARGRLHEIRARHLAQLAGQRLLVVVQQRRFQNHLDDRAGLVRHLHHRLNIAAHRIVYRRSAARRR